MVYPPLSVKVSVWLNELLENGPRVTVVLAVLCRIDAVVLLKLLPVTEKVTGVFLIISLPLAGVTDVMEGLPTGGCLTVMNPRCSCVTRSPKSPGVVVLYAQMEMP
jgi:hypothetical protein